MPAVTATSSPVACRAFKFMAVRITPFTPGDSRAGSVRNKGSPPGSFNSEIDGLSGSRCRELPHVPASLAGGTIQIVPFSGFSVPYNLCQTHTSLPTRPYIQSLGEHQAPRLPCGDTAAPGRTSNPLQSTRLVVGGWWLVVGCWFVVGYWLVVGG